MDLRPIFVVVALAGCNTKPTPEAVCDHLIELATAAQGAQGAKLALGTREQCIEHEKRQNMESRRANCQLDVCTMRAKTWSESQACLSASIKERDPGATCE